MDTPLLPNKNQSENYRQNNTQEKKHLTKGISLAILNSFIQVMIGMLYKLTFINYPKLNSLDIQFYKGAFEMIIIAVTLVILSKTQYKIALDQFQISIPERKWLIVIVLFGCCANYLVVTGINYVYLALGSLLNNTFPIFTIIVAFFLVKELPKPIQIIIIFATLGGVILMSINSFKQSEPSKQNEFLGVVMLIGSEIAGAVSFVSIKKIKETNLLIICLLKFFVIFLISAIFVVINYLVMFEQGKNIYLDMTGYLMLFSIAALEILINLLLFKSMQIEKAGLIASMNFFCLIWGLIGDVVIFNQTFTNYEIIGGIIVFLFTTSIIFTN
ncbi:drug metabolite transporter superfamily [Stylonychia lemnae]|uniref:Drug metabolite transporter superfamily n=1 Tax=Stylonychia lemnae TaxID=5949 RepID=A0A078A8U2_STYLE|nr:drug metabolite transporter superfamily [Stylonychia lemnae]|eukprot:CDW78690.1 drug metabolite transporter superfamily [Stylonychia lemnae]